MRSCGNGLEVIVDVVLACGCVVLAVEGLVHDKGFVEVYPVFKPMRLWFFFEVGLWGCVESGAPDLAKAFGLEVVQCPYFSLGL